MKEIAVVDLWVVIYSLRSINAQKFGVSHEFFSHGPQFIIIWGAHRCIVLIVTVVIFSHSFSSLHHKNENGKLRVFAKKMNGQTTHLSICLREKLPFYRERCELSRNPNHFESVCDHHLRSDFPWHTESLLLSHGWVFPKSLADFKNDPMFWRRHGFPPPFHMQ